MKVAIVGGGAAGFFSAICTKENHPQAQVVIFEKSKQLLAKVKISGGGRCNVTNGSSDIGELARAYPRGGRLMKKSLRSFNTSDTIEWFESRGVPLMTQDDGRVFPQSEYSQDIIDCFLDQTEKLDISIETGLGVQAIHQKDNKLELIFINDDPPQMFDKVIVASGGAPQKNGLEWLRALGHKISEPVPSLFTFNMPEEPITDLTGVAVDPTLVSIQGANIQSRGPLLITHWGFSGPAILRLSAFGARVLNEKNYEFKTLVNWVGESNHEEVVRVLNTISQSNPNKLLANHRPYGLPDRLWRYLLMKSALPPQKKWSELGKKGFNKLVTLLTNDVFSVSGKTGFKEEFVTCGGVSLESIDSKTMQSKVCKNLYFAGEIMDIDGITGGYNFQAAWTTAFVAAKLN